MDEAREATVDSQANVTTQVSYRRNGKLFSCEPVRYSTTMQEMTC